MGEGRHETCLYGGGAGGKQGLSLVWMGQSNIWLGEMCALATVLGEWYWGGAGGVIPGGTVSDHSIEDGEQFTHGGD